MLWSLLKAHFKNPCLVAKMNLNWAQNIFMNVNINSSFLQGPARGRTGSCDRRGGSKTPFP